MTEKTEAERRRDYWRFLRRVYQMGALEAWEYIARVGTPPTMVTIRKALNVN